MSPERAALIAKTEREVADRFEAYGIPDPADKATALIRHLQRTGWRVHPELADGVPPRPTPASRENRERARAQIQAALTRNREDQP